MPRIGPMVATDQYTLLKEGAGLVDRSERVKLVVEGTEAV